MGRMVNVAKKDLRASVAGSRDMPAAADAKNAEYAKKRKRVLKKEIEMETRNEEEIKAVCDAIRQTAYQIHLHFGTGFLEKVYENALKHRLEKLGLDVRAQVGMVVHDEDGCVVGHYDADLIVEGKIIVELKAVKALNAAHEAQLINYLKTTGIQDGMLINFGSEKFECIKRVNSASPYQPHFVVDASDDDSGNACGG